jgi:hypothetical protein
MESPTFQSGILPLITRGKIRIDKSRINVNLEFLGIERDPGISGTRQDAYNRPLVCHAGTEILEYSSLLTNIQWAKGYLWLVWIQRRKLILLGYLFKIRKPASHPQKTQIKTRILLFSRLSFRLMVGPTRRKS